MKLKTIKFLENGMQSKSTVTVELKPADLSVEEFATLRHLIDESNILEHETHMEGSPPGDYEVIITVEMTDGAVHKATFSDTELPVEYQELADFIKEVSHSVPVAPVNNPLSIS